VRWLALLALLGCADDPLDFGHLGGRCDESALWPAIDAATDAAAYAAALRGACPLPPAADEALLRWSAPTDAPPSDALRAAWDALCPGGSARVADAPPSPLGPAAAVGAEGCDLARFGVDPARLRRATDAESAVLAAVVGRALQRQGADADRTADLISALAGPGARATDRDPAVPRGRWGDVAWAADALTLPDAAGAPAASGCAAARVEADGRVTPVTPGACPDPLTLAHADAPMGALLAADIPRRFAAGPRGTALTAFTLPDAAPPGPAVDALRITSEHLMPWVDGVPRHPWVPLDDPRRAAESVPGPVVLAVDHDVPLGAIAALVVALGDRATGITTSGALTWPAGAPIAANRSWDAIDPKNLRDGYRQAAAAFDDWGVQVAGVELGATVLNELADAEPERALEAVIRDQLRRPFDAQDLLYLLDDVLASGRRGERLVVGAGRARADGVLVHPDDVYKDQERRYGWRSQIHVDLAAPRDPTAPAADGDPLGPAWTGRYPNHGTEDALLAALAAENADFEGRVRHLIAQLRDQGAEVWLTSTVRSPHRGYLMWGAFVLANQQSRRGVAATVDKLQQRNAAWGLDTPITWNHPDGWEATVAAARAMKGAYDVVYATETGARSSNHYGGVAVDLVGVGLPRTLVLKAPDGAEATFVMAADDATLDLSLSPELVRWIERHYGFRKLTSDYPHWSDARADR
jgi:hypothetical protein